MEKCYRATALSELKQNPRPQCWRVATVGWAALQAGWPTLGPFFAKVLRRASKGAGIDRQACNSPSVITAMLPTQPYSLTLAKSSCLGIALRHSLAQSLRLRRLDIRRHRVPSAQRVGTSPIESKTPSPSTQHVKTTGHWIHESPRRYRHTAQLARKERGKRLAIGRRRHDFALVMITR